MQSLKKNKPGIKTPNCTFRGKSLKKNRQRRSRRTQSSLQRTRWRARKCAGTMLAFCDIRKESRVPLRFPEATTRSPWRIALPTETVFAVCFMRCSSVVIVANNIYMARYIHGCRHKSFLSKSAPTGRTRLPVLIMAERVRVP